MRKLSLLGVALGLLAGSTACSGSKPDPDKKDGPKVLKVGDPAPPFKAVEWRNGPAVPSFEPGKVYVVEFWATWCGPCIQAMPHLSGLQAEYKDQGLVVLAVTTLDSRNTKPAVEKFVKDTGAKFKLTFGMFDTEETDEDYRKAAGIEGIPASFVVDRDGKIAYIGRPHHLDDVLPQVLAGTWKGVADADRVAKMNEQLEVIVGLASEAPDQGVKDLENFEKKYPEKAAQPAYQVDKVGILVAAKEYDKARAVTEAVLPKLVAGKNVHALEKLRDPWLNANARLNSGKAHADLVVKVADAVLAAGPTDPSAYYYAAMAHANAGDDGRAIDLAREYVSKAADEEQKLNFQVGQMIVYIQVRRTEEAAALAKTLIPQLAAKKDDQALQTVRGVWTSERYNPTRAHLELAVQAADAALALDGRGTDPETLILAAETYYTAGNKAKAVDLARKAIQNESNEQRARQLRAKLRQYEQ